jgi:hypothetical protein
MGHRGRDASTLDASRLWILARRRVGDVGAGLAGAAWIADAHIRALALLGVETSLAVLCILLLMLAIQNERSLGVVGALVGVTFLARTDSIFITVPIVIGWLWRRDGVRAWRMWARDGIRAGLMALVVASPWLVYLGARGGVQDSAAAERLTFGHGYTWSFVPAVLRFTAGHVAFAVLPRGAHAEAMAPGRAEALLLGLALIAVLAGARVPAIRSWLTVVGGLAVGAALLLLLESVAFGYVAAWYVLYPALAFWTVVVLPLSALVVHVGGRLGSRPLWRVGWVVVVAVLILDGFAPHPDFEPGQLDKYLAVRDLDHQIPPLAKVGAFNAGLVGFFRPGSIDLDGVVEPRIIPPSRHHEVCSWLRNHDVQWLLDDPSTIPRILNLSPGLRLGPPLDLAARAHRGVVGQPQVLVHLDTSRC